MLVSEEGDQYRGLKGDVSTVIFCLALADYFSTDHPHSHGTGHAFLEFQTFNHVLHLSAPTRKQAFQASTAGKCNES